MLCLQCASLEDYISRTHICSTLLRWSSGSDTRRTGDDLTRPRRPGISPSGALTTQDHDLGAVLTDGEPLIHTFRVINPSRSTVRLNSVEPQVPCCSSVESVAKWSLASGEEAQVKVQLQAGSGSGPRSVAFHARTDSREWPGARLGLRAVIYGDFELENRAETMPRFLVNRVGKLQFDVNTRKSAKGSGGGRSPPEAVESVGPVRARFVFEPIESKEGGGLVVATRRLVEVQHYTSGQLRRLGTAEPRGCLIDPLDGSEVHAARAMQQAARVACWFRAHTTGTS